MTTFFFFIIAILSFPIALLYFGIPGLIVWTIVAVITSVLIESGKKQRKLDKFHKELLEEMRKDNVAPQQKQEND